jgi:hypothetical protein
MIWAYLENVLEVPPFPAISDLFYLLFAPLVVAGLLYLPSAPINRRERWQFVMEMLVFMTAAFMLMWHFVIQPTAVVSAGDLVTQIVSIAYPVTDLVLFAGIAAALLRKPDHDTRQALWLLLVAMACFIAADVAFAYTSLVGTYATGSWIDALWNFAFLFILFAALRHSYRTPEGAEAVWEPNLVQGLRIALNLIVVLAFVLTIYVGIRDFYQRGIPFAFGYRAAGNFTRLRKLLSAHQTGVCLPGRDACADGCAVLHQRQCHPAQPDPRCEYNLERQRCPNSCRAGHFLCRWSQQCTHCGSSQYI